MHQEKSIRVLTIEKHFNIQAHHQPWQDPSLPQILPGQIILITGPSGSGKSRLLRRLMALSRLRDPDSWIDVDRIRIPDRPVVDCFHPIKLDRILQTLNRVGLAEAFLYLQNAWQLSDGQRWRLKLAKAMLKAKVKSKKEKGQNQLRVIAADEFCALLDRVSAAVIARMLRKTIDASPCITAIVATSHEDLARALDPDLHIQCDFQGKAIVTYRASAPPAPNYSLAPHL